MKTPRIAIVNPPITGHKQRGTGLYGDNLYRELRLNENINVKQANINDDLREFDLVHFPYFDPFFLTLPFFRNYKSIVTVHDLIPFKFPDYFPKGIKGSFKWEIQKQSLKRSGLILTDSSDSKIDIHRFTGIKNEKIKVVYLGVNENFIKVKSKKALIKVKYKFNLPEKFLLNVGDVNYNKNISGLIDAFRKVEKENPEYFLILVGNGFVNPSSNLKELEKLINRLGLDRKIKRLGHVSDVELRGLYNLADIYIQPSFAEGFGLPILEAFACGCPVISSNISSLPEITGDAALQINPYDIGNITNQILVLINSQTLKKVLVEDGFKQVKKFSWKKCARETVNAYLEVIT